MEREAQALEAPQCLNPSTLARRACSPVGAVETHPARLEAVLVGDQVPGACGLARREEQVAETIPAARGHSVDAAALALGDERIPSLAHRQAAFSNIVTAHPMSVRIGVVAGAPLRSGRGFGQPPRDGQEASSCIRFAQPALMPMESGPRAGWLDWPRRPLDEHVYRAAPDCIVHCERRFNAGTKCGVLERMVEEGGLST